LLSKSFVGLIVIVDVPFPVIKPEIILTCSKVLLSCVLFIIMLPELKLTGSLK